MPQDINSALIRLEENLEKVNSAREEVERTVSSASDLQVAISQYANSLNSYREELKDYVQLVQNRLKEIDDAIQIFKEDANETLKPFVDENKKLEDQVNSLVALRVSISNSSENVANILYKLNSFSDRFDVSTKDLNEGISAIKSTTQSLSNDTKEKYLPLWNSIESKANTVCGRSQEIINSLDQNKKYIDESLEKLQIRINTSFSAITKKVNRNLLIMIAGFVAVLAAIILK